VLALIVANVRRRMARTSLTAAGIAVGVAALLALSAGLDATAAQLVHLGKADLGMFQADASDPTASLLPLSLLPRVRNEPFVSAATPIQLVTGAVARDQSAFVF
jgi:ABC-type antimicrobial peptide transport system permease subunit